MKTRKLGLAAFLSAAALISGYIMVPTSSLVPVSAHAAENTGSVTFPELEALVHYTTVRRGVTREHMLTNQTAIDAIQSGQPIPKGTHVVLVDHQSDVLARYLVAEKTGDGATDWAYQAFTPERAIKTDDESPERCFSCHLSRQDRQFMFTYNDARSFRP